MLQVGTQNYLMKKKDEHNRMMIKWMENWMENDQGYPEEEKRELLE